MDRRANRDSRNLAYFEPDVIDCICRLTSFDYHKTVEFDDPKAGVLRYDVYQVRCTNSNGNTDDIYLKLRVSGGVWIFVGSFKLR